MITHKFTKDIEQTMYCFGSSDSGPGAGGGPQGMAVGAAANGQDVSVGPNGEISSSGAAPGTDGYTGTGSHNEPFAQALKNSLNLKTGIGMFKATPVLGTLGLIGEVMSRMGGTVSDSTPSAQGGNADQRRALITPVKSATAVDDTAPSQSLVVDPVTPPKTYGVINRLNKGLF